MRAAARLRQQLDVLLGDVLRDADRVEQPNAVILVRKHVIKRLRRKRKRNRLSYCLILSCRWQLWDGFHAHLAVSDVQL